MIGCSLKQVSFGSFTIEVSNWSNNVTPFKHLLFQNRPVSGSRLNTKQTIILPSHAPSSAHRPQRTPIIRPDYIPPAPLVGSPSLHTHLVRTLRKERESPTFTPNTSPTHYRSPLIISPPSFILSTSLIPLLQSSARAFAICNCRSKRNFRLSSVLLAEPRLCQPLWPPPSF